jgi:glycerophosphoryl diester phosphodiesterase
MLHPYLSDISQKRIQQAHQKGIRLHTWTVNQEQDMCRLYRWGIDGLFTDYPALAMSLIHCYEESNGEV